MKYLKDTDVVLDYGCGTGTTACEISSLVKRVPAIDISYGMIEIPKVKAASGGVVNVVFNHADIFDEQLKSADLDALLSDDRFDVTTTEDFLKAHPATLCWQRKQLS